MKQTRKIVQKKRSLDKDEYTGPYFLFNRIIKWHIYYDLLYHFVAYLFFHKVLRNAIIFVNLRYYSSVKYQSIYTCSAKYQS